MSQKKDRVDQLYIYMNGIRVGTLNREWAGRLQFRYEESWFEFSEARPISLSMPLTNQVYSGDKVENYFDNLLPDNEKIRRRIRARFKARSTHCFDLLAEIGLDCVGALQIVQDDTIGPIKKIHATPMSDIEIAALLQHYQTAPLGMQPDTDFRISIAGAQEKTALLWYENQWNLPHGTTPTSHIIKLPIGYIQHSGMDLSDSVENEYCCLQILSAYGLPVNHAEVKKFDNTTALVLERFDRRWSQDGSVLLRLPQEDMCQAQGIFSDFKYENDGGPGILQIMELLSGAYDVVADRERFMKSVFLFWVLGAIDGHAKNFSIFLDAGGRFRLTPLYDVMSAYPLVVKQQLSKNKMKMAMAVKGKNRHYRWLDIQLRHWFSTAADCHFPKTALQRIIDEVFDEMEAVIDTVRENLPNNFPIVISEVIFDNMLRLKKRMKTRD